jgi:ABC-2 type transport system ATP-binding protein
MTSVIRTVALTKRYRSATVVDRLDLDVGEGDLFGFLGPNGSGKTTTIRMLLGLVYPDAGDIDVLGRPMPRDRSRILPEVGVMVEGPAFYPHLSGRANLSLLDSAAGGGRRTRPSRVGDSLARVGLERAGRKPVKAYSTGMRQRLGLAAALVRPRRLLILDEPTNGLDPHATAEVKTLLKELVASNVTVFLSSHLLGEIEQICNRAAIVAGGRVVAQDRVAALLAPTGRLRIETPDIEAAEHVVARDARLRLLEQTSRGVTVHLDGATPEALVAALVDGGVRVRGLVPETKSLERVFLDLTAPSQSSPAGGDGVPG